MAWRILEDSKLPKNEKVFWIQIQVKEKITLMLSVNIIVKWKNGLLLIFLVKG